MPFEISATRHFSAAHAIKLYDGSLEPLHGHNWKVIARVESRQLDQIGVVMDFHELDRLLGDITSPMHNSNLNDHPAFKSLNPTTENVALYIAEKLKLPRQVHLASIEVWETAENSVVYRPR